MTYPQVLTHIAGSGQVYFRTNQYRCDAPDRIVEMMSNFKKGLPL